MQKIFIKTLSLIVLLSTLLLSSPVYALEENIPTSDVPVLIMNELSEDNESEIIPYFTILPYDAVTPVQSLTVTAESNQTFNTPSSHTFTENGTFTFIVVDSMGNGSLYPVTITNIDTTAPVITVAPYNTASTTDPITVSVATSEGALNQTSYTFTTNGSFTFIATDAAGNVTSQTVTISNIVPVVVNTGGGSGGSSSGSSSGGTIDRCSNIVGIQATVPTDYTVEGNNRICIATITPTVVAPTEITPVGQVLGAETIGQVLGAEKFKFTLDLKFGDRNDEVMELQKRLIADGLMTGPATGLFWTKTLAGVRSLQKLNGIRTIGSQIKTTGNVGPLTRAVLNK
jgi:hypothetical protein